MDRINYIILLIFISVAAGAQEKLFIRTDKSTYHAGETIWFRVDLSPAGSSIAYVELLDSINTPVLQRKIKLTDGWGGGYFEIPADLHGANYLLRGYTNLMKNFGPESFFASRVTIINLLKSRRTEVVPDITEYDQDAGIRTDKQSYKTREKVTVHLDRADRTINANFNKLSVSVYKFDSLLSPGVEMPGFPPATMSKSEYYEKESGGDIITGTVKDVKTGNAAAHADCYLSVIGPSNIFYGATSDSSGHLIFEIDKAYGHSQLVLQTADSTLRMELDDDFSKAYTAVSPRAEAVAVKDYNTLLDHAVSAQVQSIYHRDKDDTVQLFLRDTLPFYGYAEYNYMVDDYVKFSSIEDIFREYIRPVQIYKRAGGTVPIIFLDKERRLMDHSPFVLIDNVPVLNMQKLMQINPARLLRIDVVDWPYWYKRQLYEGIISVFTKSKDPTDYLSPNAIVKDFIGLQIPRNFDLPSYDTEAKRSSRIPDFRNVLYWSPHVDSQVIEFYTSDMPGNYVIDIRGINEKAEFIRNVAAFKVK